MTVLTIFCNPLLDISVDVDQDFLDAHQLKSGGAILAEDEALHGDAFFKKLAAHPTVQQIAGGSAMNTARVCAWLLESNVPKVSFIGSVGTDENGTRLCSSAQSSSVDVGAMYTVEDTPTGLCGVLIVGKERSLVARLAAANKFPISHMSSSEVQKRLKETEHVYISGYFLTVCPEGAIQVAKECSVSGKRFYLNLSAPFIVQVPPFLAAVKQLLPLCDILFGNETEAAALAAAVGMSPASTNVEEIAKYLVDHKFMKETGQICFTQGSQATIFYDAKAGIQNVTVPRVENIIDTNGAGDSFVGGFLSGIIREQPIETCIKIGHYSAGEVIQRSGCAFPEKSTFKV